MSRLHEGGTLGILSSIKNILKQVKRVIPMISDEKSQSEAQTKFCVKTRGGNYARVEVRIIPEYNEAASVDLAVYLNRSDSVISNLTRKRS